MEAFVKINSTTQVKVEGETHIDLFEGLSSVQEVFSQSSACGVCKGEDVKFLVRTNKDEDKFYELSCGNLSCRARLSYGCLKKPKGSLYPKRTWDSLSPGEKQNRKSQESLCKNGWLPNGGWYVFSKNATTEVKQPETENAQPETGDAPF